jgi:RNA polymerase sigma-70 factor (ECF subfamily)
MTQPDDLAADLRASVATARKAFVTAANALRPRLHRFCTRMVGSSLDGEDLVQETLAEAFYGLASLKDPTRFEAWMFRIAYHKCIDFVRRDDRRLDDVAFEDEHDRPDEPAAETPTDDALAALVNALPPKERAAVVLKDVLGYQLAEVAEIADSTLGGAKAALHRAREKLRDVKAVPSVVSFDDEQRKVFDAYADCFNRRDWEGLKQLVSADARLEIVGEAEGRMSGLGASYSGNYTKLPWEWRLEAGVIDGAPVIVHSRRVEGEWRAYSAIRLSVRGGKIVHIRDYIHIEYLLASRTSACLSTDGTM